MKKFQTVKVTFEAYIAVTSNTNMEALQETLYTKLADKMEMYCTDNAFGLTENSITLEPQND